MFLFEIVKILLQIAELKFRTLVEKGLFSASFELFKIERTSLIIQFWSGFIPVKGGGRIYPTLKAISPTLTLHLARFMASFSKPTLLFSSTCIFYFFGCPCFLLWSSSLICDSSLYGIVFACKATSFCLLRFLKESKLLAEKKQKEEVSSICTLNLIGFRVYSLIKIIFEAFVCTLFLNNNRKDKYNWHMQKCIIHRFGRKRVEALYWFSSTTVAMVEILSFAWNEIPLLAETTGSMMFQKHMWGSYSLSP